VSWVRIDDKAWSHPKLAGLSGNAVRLWLFGLCWCNQQESDGRVPASMLRLFGASTKVAAELVEAGLWLATDGGWEFHDYLNYQPSREQLSAQRNATRDRVTRHRERERNGVTGGVSNSGVTAPPIPTRPDPNPTKSEPPVSPPVGDDSTAVDVRRVFQAWQEIHNHPDSKLDDGRKRRIQARLREKFTADRLIRALKNAKNDRFLMGENEHGRVYDGIETLLKNAAQVERLEALTAAPAPPRPTNTRTAAADHEVDRQQQNENEIQRARLQRNAALLGGS
jgi:hypothetical protein